MPRIFFLISLFFQLSLLFAQSDSGKFIFFPGHKGDWKINYFAGVSMAQLPEKITEDEFEQGIMLNLAGSLNMPYNFSLNAKFETSGLTNLFTLAPSYSIKTGNFAAAAGNEFLLWYCFYQNEGFDVEVNGWGFSPYISLGYDLKDCLLSLKFEGNIKAQDTYLKGYYYRKSSPKFTGYSLTFTCEQPLWGNNYLALGIKTNYTKFFYKSRIVFPVINDYHFYTELFAGLVF